MTERQIKAVLFGATGLAGSGVLYECLKHPEVNSVLAVTRRSTGITHPKLTEIIHDNYLDYSSISDHLKGVNTCFYCLGISQTQAGNREEYRRITYDYTMAAAKALTDLNKDITFCFLSGAGTDPSLKSRFMWAQVKGEAMINAVLSSPEKNVFENRDIRSLGVTEDK